jgi:hypothetical protein
MHFGSRSHGSASNIVVTKNRKSEIEWAMGPTTMSVLVKRYQSE